ncbi:hypothetical protein D3C81_1262050 [compost metagenome]
MTEAAEQKQLACDLCVSSHHGTTFRAMEQLSGVEAQGAAVAKVCQRLAIELGAEGMGGVVDDFEAIGAGDILNALDSAGVAVDMGCQDAASFFRDRSFDQLGVDAQRLWVDIHEHRLAAFPDDCIGRRHIAEGGSDDLALQAQGANRQLQGEGAVGHQLQVLHPQVVAHGRAQRAYQFTVVGELATVPDVPDLLDIFVNGRQEGPGHRYHVLLTI